MNKTALLASVIVAAVGVVLFGLYMKRFEAEVRGGDPVTVLIATQDVPIGTALTTEMLGSRELPQKFVEARHVKEGDVSKVLGVKVSVGLRANQSVLWSDLATANSELRDLSRLLREGMRAITVRVGGTSAFGGLLRAGDRVDVLYTNQRPGSDEKVTVPLLQNVLVLAVGDDTGGVDRDKSSRRSKDVSMAVSIEQAALVSHAMDSGSLQLILRNPDDVRILEGIGDTTDADLIEAEKRIRRSRPARPEPTKMIEAIR